MNIDMMLEKAGDFGRYQIFLMFLFSIVNILAAFHYFSQTFISVIPDHWCNSTDISNIGLNESNVLSIKNYLAPLPNPSCTRFQWNDTGESPTVVMVGNNLTFEGNDERGWTPVKCESGWIYDRYNGFESIISELNWVCDDDWKPFLAQSLFSVGSVVGTLFLGVLADVIGRLPVLSIANVLALVGNLATVFTHSFPLFTACRFLSGMATDSNFVMMYIIVMEYVRPSMRTIGLNLCIGIFYCLGCVVVPLVAISLVTWRIFLLATTIPMAFIVTFYFMFFLVLAFAVAAHAQYHHQPAYQQASAGYSHGHEEYHDHPKYEFAYDVKDEKTGDYHGQHETRDGDHTKGFYTLIDADGYKRTVEYSVEGKSGFNAVVHREPTGHAPAPAAPKHHAPQYHAPAPHYSGHKY